MSEQRRTIIMDTLRDPKKILAIAACVAATAVTACGGSGDNDPTKAAKVSSANAGCEQVDGFKDFSTNANNYEEASFLPEAKNGIDSPEETQAYVEGLLGDKGETQKADPNSLAALVSAVTEPARDEKAADPKYDYVGEYEAAVAAYGAEGGVERAKEDCADTAETLTQVTSYDEKWAAKGDRVTQIIATRNEDNEIVGMRLANKVVKGEDGLSGASFELPDSNSNLDGFTPVLATEEGELFVKGITVDDNKSRGDERKKKGDKSEKKNQKHEGEDQAQADNGGGSSENQESNTGTGTGPTGSNGGGGSGENRGTGGGHGGTEGGGCGGSGCGGSKGGGGNGGSGGGGTGGGCGSCGGTGGGTPTPAPTPAPAPAPEPNPGGGGGGGNPAPEPNPGGGGGGGTGGGGGGVKPAPVCNPDIDVC